MIEFTTTILKFEEQGEKTRWTYIIIEQEHATVLHPADRKSFRVKGKLDKHPIKQIALLPRVGSGYIMPLNAEMRKALGKKAGDTVAVQLAKDSARFVFSHDMMDCLNDEPKALSNFEKLPDS